MIDDKLQSTLVLLLSNGATTKLHCCLIFGKWHTPVFTIIISKLNKYLVLVCTYQCTQDTKFGSGHVTITRTVVCFLQVSHGNTTNRVEMSTCTHTTCPPYHVCFQPLLEHHHTLYASNLKVFPKVTSNYKTTYRNAVFFFCKNFN